MDVPRVAVSADLVILTVREGSLAALVWRRTADPYQGLWALPGGFIRGDEDLPATASRVLGERRHTSSSYRPTVTRTAIPDNAWWPLLTWASPPTCPPLTSRG